MSILPQIAGFWQGADGFCRPDWAAIEKVVADGLPQAAWNDAWISIEREWLERLRGPLGAAYHIHESRNFLVLSAEVPRVLHGICESWESAFKQIRDNLAGVADDDGYGKHVVLMFADLDGYYAHIAPYYQDGEHSMSGGVCLTDESFTHFAFPALERTAFLATIVHELTHGCLAHLPLPHWLNEAVAMRMEQLVGGAGEFRLDREKFEEHVAYWNPATIRLFWSGETWEHADESFSLSYELARILWMKIEQDLCPPRQKLLGFIATAQRDDAGDAACRAAFGIGLGELVADFLGEGAWDPLPA